MDVFKVIPKEVDGVRLVNGIEANIFDEHGSIDVEEPILSKMDYIIASLHTPCIANLGIVKNTAALVGAAENLNVTVIGHPDDDRYPIDPDEVAAAAAENHTAIELNNGSLNPGSTDRKISGRSWRHAKSITPWCSWGRTAISAMRSDILRIRWCC